MNGYEVGNAQKCSLLSRLDERMMDGNEKKEKL